MTAQTAQLGPVAPELAPTPAKAKSSGTPYVVLKRDQSGKAWEPVATITAASGSAAIRAHVTAQSIEGTFVAVPARSWQPVTVTTKTETKLTFG